jgi:iron complex outermembrane recepter protein
MANGGRMLRPYARSLLLVTAGLVIAAASAQESDNSLKEIIVTAQKREENLQTAPVSVTAVDAEMLTARGVTDISRLDFVAPNVDITTSLVSDAIIDVYIRGLGNDDYTYSFDSPVTVYVDGVPLGSQAGAVFDMIDLERVEVLRGPQGTLYGRNTIGGAVNFISAKPSETAGFEQKFTEGSFHRFESRTRVESGDIGDTGLKAQLSYVHKDSDGYVRNTLQGDPGKWPGAQHLDAVRAALRWDQGGPFRANYSYELSIDNSTPPATQALALYPGAAAYYGVSPLLGGSAPVVAADRLGTLALDREDEDRNEIQGHTLTLEGDLANDMTIKSLTGFRRFEMHSPAINADGQGGLEGLILNPATGAVAPAPVGIFSPTEFDHVHQVSEELDLLGKAFDKKLDYVVGAFYYDQKAEEYSPAALTYLVPIPGGVPVGNTTIPVLGLSLDPLLAFTHFSESEAVFGQGTYHLNDSLDLTAGVRYTHDYKHLIQNDSNANRDVAAGFDKTNWAVSAGYKLTSDIMAYARIATGYRAGGFNARSSDSAAFEPETGTDYEGGFKTELLDRRVRFNIDYYFTDYSNLQLQQFEAGTAGATSITVNAGKAHYRGVEMDMEALLGAGFSMNGNLGTSNRHYLEYDVRDPVSNQIINIGGIVHGTNAPDLTANAGLQYDSPPVAAGQFSARVDYSYRSRVYYHPSTFTTPNNDLIASGGHGVLDARLTMSKIMIHPVELAVSAWVKNLTNKYYIVEGVDFGPGIGASVVNFGPPRSAGLDLTAKF